jgi:hypothetical protein
MGIMATTTAIDTTGTRTESGSTITRKYSRFDTYTAHMGRTTGMHCEECGWINNALTPDVIIRHEYAHSRLTS